MSERLKIFEAYGIELEYMIVDKDTLAVKPITDELLKAALGNYGSDYENGPVTWSNELVLHVVELKCTKPEADFPALERNFHSNIEKVNGLLAQWNAMLLPSAAHPLMNPHRDTKLWPHDNNEVYEIYNRIFDCRGHGWSNLQSMHINLPFANDKEFARLHAAIRIVLPLLPALCASSPILDGQPTGFADSRLTFYKTNQAKIPSITGDVIPEPVFSETEHEEVILKKIAADIAPFNADEILDPVWVNSRGAMSRFDRGSIEIRVMDIQECPAADLAIATLVIETIKALASEQFADLSYLKKVKTLTLVPLFENVIRNGHQTMVDNSEFLACFNEKEPLHAQDLWLSLVAHLEKRGNPQMDKYKQVLATLLQAGTLSHRILRSVGKAPSEGAITETYRELSRCLANNRLFIP